MDVTITQFRKDLFKLFERASKGEAIRVSHRGERFRISPEGSSRSKLSRITPAPEFVNHKKPLADATRQLRKEMNEALEQDWAEL